MDAARFDRLARSLATRGTRRRVLSVLSALPLGGVLTALLAAEAGAERPVDNVRHRAKQRQKKRKNQGDKPNNGGTDKRHGKGKGKGKDSGCQPEPAATTCKNTCGAIENNCGTLVNCGRCPCQPESKATTCAGKCGTVKNNCGTRVDCGSCGCEPRCSPCKTCNEETGNCEADPAREDEACGTCRHCADGRCVKDRDRTACGAGGMQLCCNGACRDCCDRTDCLAPECQTCSARGVCKLVADGTDCGGGNVCCGGRCKTCCTASDCDPCQTCNGDGQCVADATQDRSCCDGASGEKWCDAGSCEPIPDDALATLAECGGRCDCPPDPAPNACGGIRIRANTAICGKTLDCLNCADCRAAPNTCDSNTKLDGPEGFFEYCINSVTADFCDSGSQCPDPDTQGCGGSNCWNICYGADG